MSDIDLPVGADPALARPRPDVGFFAWNMVRSLGNVIVYEYSATEGDPGSWLATTSVQVDCRAHNRQRAGQLADQVRRMMKALPWAAWDDGVINAVRCTDGPRWQPDENGGPRYVARYDITHHPRQGMA